MGTRSPEQQRTYYGFIDGLRGVAVASVVAYHLSHRALGGGFTGVDVFFVISGFVVSTASAKAMRDQRATFWQVATRFYARRVRRIIPALAVCLTTIMVVSTLLLPRTFLSRANPETGLLAFVGLSNFSLARNAFNYFAPGVDFNPFTHTWSLGVEEQFYFTFPFLLFLYLRGGVARRIARVIVGLTILVSLLVAVRYAHTGLKTQSFYLLQARFWELAAGIAIFLWLNAKKAPLRYASIVQVVGAVLVVAGLVFARANSTPWPDSLFAVVGTALLIAGTVEGDSLIRRALETRGLLGLGRMSYSLYLWHWPIFVMFRWTVGLDTPLTKAAALLLALGAAWLSFRFVERPVRYSPRLSRLRPIAVIGVVGLSAAVLASVSFVVADNDNAVGLSTVNRHAADWNPQFARVSLPKTCELRRSSRHHDGFGVTEITRAGCAAPSAPGELFVVGDSHAAAYSAMVSQYSADTASPVHLYERGGCPVVPLWTTPVAGCLEANRTVLREIAEGARPGQTVFLPSLRLTRLVSQSDGIDKEEAMRRLATPSRVDDEAVANAVEELRPIAEAGVQIIFEAPTPIFPSIALRCVDWYLKVNRVCRGGLVVKRSLMENYRSRIVAAMTTIASKVPNVSVWDPLPTLCDAQFCRAISKGRPLFSDGDHLSGHANLLLAPGFGRAVAAAQAAGSAPVG